MKSMRHDDFFVGGMPLPGSPARVADADHHESPFVTVGAVLGAVP